MLAPTNKIAPIYFAVSILNLDTGFDISISIVPLSTIDVMNDDAEISEKNNIKAEKNPLKKSFFVFAILS